MKIWIVLLFVSFGCVVNAQKVLVDGEYYLVKGSKISKDGVDVTSIMSIDKKHTIITEAKKINEEIEAAKLAAQIEKEEEKAEKEKEKAEKEREKEEKEQEKEEKEKEKEIEKKEKEREKAEKEREKAEKEKEKARKEAAKEKEKKQKAKEKYNEAEEDYDSANSKYQKLKNKGKLSPVDEEKWAEKLRKLKDAQNKAKRKL